MVKYGISWDINVRETHRNGAKWLTKVKKMQNLWQFKSLCPCHKRTVIVIRSYGSFILPFTPKTGLIEHFLKKMPSLDQFPGWVFLRFKTNFS